MRIACTISMLALMAATPVAAQDAGARLAAADALPAPQLAERQSEFLAWLDSAGRPLPPQQAQGAVEYLYYLIGSAAKAHQQRTGAFFPANDTLGLAGLFERAHGIGLPGAELVADALQNPSNRASDTVSLEGGTMRLSFRSPDYTLASNRGWSIRFPFYMMIGAAQTGAPANNIPTETVVLSTLFAEDSSEGGRSQATMLINAAAAADSAAHVPFWLRMLGVSESDRVAEGGGADGATYRQFDREQFMHKEIVVTRRGDVVLVVAYVGLPGTFQANRGEFEALLASLSGRAPHQ